jgi:hypothetical protein
LKTRLQRVFFLLASLSILLIPWRSEKTGAYPGNLYTSSGQWSRPADPARIFSCVRTEYGLGLSWLVYDRGEDQDAWYVKFHGGIFCLHLFTALAASACAMHLFRGRAGHGTVLAAPSQRRS